MGIRGLGNPTARYIAKFSRTGDDTNAVPPAPTNSPVEATGGSTATYTDPAGDWKVHKFIASGSLVVTDIGSGTGSAEIDIMVVGGGGAGEHLTVVVAQVVVF